MYIIYGLVGEIIKENRTGGVFTIEGEGGPTEKTCLL